MFVALARSSAKVSSAYADRYGPRRPAAFAH